MRLVLRLFFVLYFAVCGQVFAADAMRVSKDHLRAAALLAAQPKMAAVPVNDPSDALSAKITPYDPEDHWYLRGDLGLRSYTRPTISLSCGCPTDGEFLRGSATISVGFGYQLDHNLRTDVTLDWAPASELTGTAHSSTGVVNLTDDNTLRTTLSNATLMLNGYYDFDIGSNFHPYIGAGLGADGVWSSAITFNGTFHHGGRSELNMAAATMAGVSYSISKNIAWDLGYRFLWIGRGRSDGQDTYSNIAAHEVRTGLRYTFD